MGGRIARPGRWFSEARPQSAGNHVVPFRRRLKNDSIALLHLFHSCVLPLEAAFDLSLSRPKMDPSEVCSRPPCSCPWEGQDIIERSGPAALQPPWHLSYAVQSPSTLVLFPPPPPPPPPPQYNVWAGQPFIKSEAESDIKAADDSAVDFSAKLFNFYFISARRFSFLILALTIFFSKRFFWYLSSTSYYSLLSLLNHIGFSCSLIWVIILTIFNTSE